MTFVFRNGKLPRIHVHFKMSCCGSREAGQDNPGPESSPTYWVDVDTRCCRWSGSRSFFECLVFALCFRISFILRYTGTCDFVSPWRAVQAPDVDVQIFQRNFEAEVILLSFDWTLVMAQFSIQESFWLSGILTTCPAHLTWALNTRHACMFHDFSVRNLLLSLD
jgi:hypothetical protein